MSEASNARSTSHTMAWTGAIFGALLLYFLSVPWVAALTHGHSSLYVWMEWYGTPFDFVIGHSPHAVQKPVTDYVDWCWRKAGVTP